MAGGRDGPSVVVLVPVGGRPRGPLRADDRRGGRLVDAVAQPQAAAGRQADERLALPHHNHLQPTTFFALPLYVLKRHGFEVQGSTFGGASLRVDVFEDPLAFGAGFVPATLISSTQPAAEPS